MRFKPNAGLALTTLRSRVRHLTNRAHKKNFFNKTQYSLYTLPDRPIPDILYQLQLGRN